jgi:hypothetical protein
MKVLEASTMASAAGPAESKKRALEISETDLPLEERIRARAHEIWLRRGGQDGSDTDDWLQAEEEIVNAG